jgi:hypothetical protein
MTPEHEERFRRIAEDYLESAHGSCDIAESTPQTPGLEWVKAEVLVEAHRVVADRVDHHGARTKLPGATHAPPECINEQMAAERVAVLGAIHGQAREQDDRNGVRHAPPKS